MSAFARLIFGNGRFRTWALVAAAAVLLLLSVAMLPAKAALSVEGDWWDLAWRYRVAVTVGAAGYVRQDKPALVPVDFTALLSEAGSNDAFQVDSLRVVEVDGDNKVLDEAVDFQFDRAPGFDPVKKAQGTLVILLRDTTPANGTRRFHVYFDTAGSGFEPAVVRPLIRLFDNAVDEQYASYRLQMPGSELFYHKSGGGFSSYLDADGNDWISWNSAPGAAGDFRGVPNLAHPADGGYFHPGRDLVNSAVVRRGPLHVMIRSTSYDSLWQTRWDIYPTYSTLTVERAPVAYWVQYEGTPGGVFEPAVDVVVRPDGATNLAGETWVGDLVGPEWAYVSDPVVDRSLFFIHHEEDNIVDSYRPLDNRMTILAFGRNEANGRFLTAASQTFTMGLADSVEFETVRAAIDSAYQPLTVESGAVEVRPVSPTDTPTPLPTSTPTMPPTDTPSPTMTAVPTETPMPEATPTETPMSEATPTETRRPTRTPVPTETATPGPTVEPGDYRVYLSIAVRP